MNIYFNTLTGTHKLTGTHSFNNTCIVSFYLFTTSHVLFSPPPPPEWSYLQLRPWELLSQSPAWPGSRATGLAPISGGLVLTASSVLGHAECQVALNHLPNLLLLGTQLLPSSSISL